jgi:hypothetical protein
MPKIHEYVYCDRFLNKHIHLLDLQSRFTMGIDSANEVSSTFHMVSKTQQKERNKYNYFIISSANLHWQPQDYDRATARIYMSLN